MRKGTIHVPTIADTVKANHDDTLSNKLDTGSQQEIENRSVLTRVPMMSRSKLIMRETDEKDKALYIEGVERAQSRPKPKRDAAKRGSR
jgi:hypothetical protein